MAEVLIVYVFKIESVWYQGTAISDCYEAKREMTIHHIIKCLSKIYKPRQRTSNIQSYQHIICTKMSLNKHKRCFSF